VIRNQPQHQLEQFYSHWTLKEAYIKALGIGLGLELLRIEFRQQQQQQTNDSSSPLPLDPNRHNIIRTDTHVYLDGRHQPQWYFEGSYLDSIHPISVALGPLEEAHGTYRNTFSPSCFSTPSSSSSSSPSPIPFRRLQISDLLPESQL
jgi:hypothetical protein